MVKNNVNNCCCCGNGSDASCTMEESRCPSCGEQGVEVKNITVSHMVLDKLKGQIGKDDYYICKNEGCDIIYYNKEENSIFDRNQIIVPVWFKKDADPKYICYCSRVTEEQILNAVIKENAKDMKDIVRLTGAMKNGKCEINNPLGKCCSHIIQKTINKALDMKNHRAT